VPATPITVSERFVALETTKVIFLPTVADTAFPRVPTRAEIDAGTDLSGEIVDWAGWTVRTNYITTPSLSTRFQPKLADTVEAEDSSLTFAGDKSGDDVRGLLASGDGGFILFADGGDVTGYLADLFPVEVASVSAVRQISGQEFRVRADFSQIQVPSLGITLPATA
jgi:hypothetical protein